MQTLLCFDLETFRYGVPYETSDIYTDLDISMGRVTCTPTTTSLTQLKGLPSESHATSSVALLAFHGCYISTARILSECIVALLYCKQMLEG